MLLMGFNQLPTSRYKIQDRFIEENHTQIEIYARLFHVQIKCKIKQSRE